MLVLESIRAAGRSGIISFGRVETPKASRAWALGLKRPSVGAFCGLWVGSEDGGGAAGNLNSGMGFGDREPLCDPSVLGAGGEVGGIRPKRSGGYDALSSGELVCLGEKEAVKVSACME